MMKSNSLKNRLLALALTVVMLIGMLPTGVLATGTVTVRFDNSTANWSDVVCVYEDTDGNQISAGQSTDVQENLHSWTLPEQSVSVAFQNYLPGQSESDAPAEGFLSTGFMAVAADTTYTYTPSQTEVTYVAQVGETKYETLAEAVAAAEAGATVTLLGNASGAGVVVNKSVTIDFGGFTYTLTEGVGSTGTPSNGLQLLAGNSVVLKNGTLKVADEARSKFYILVQNYANLTVSGMTLDGTNLDKWSGTDGDSYTLSINSGSVLIDGSAIIANNEGALAYAFDVCQYGSYPVPNVKVTSGTISGNVDTGSIGTGTLTITGGSFTSDVSAYVAEGYQLVGGTVRMDTVVTPLTGGTVTQQADGTIVVEVANVTLGWSDETAAHVGGWWAGIKITAPSCLTDEQLQGVTYYSNENGPKNFWNAKDSTAAPHYMEAWMLLNPEILAAEASDDGYATMTYKFDWNKDSVCEQVVVFKVKADSVTLLQEDQETLSFNQAAVTMTYGDEVPANELLGGTGDGAVTYQIISEGGADIIDLAADGTVTVKKIGTVTIQATKAASGKYAQANAAYTLTIEPRPVTVYVNNCEKVYGEDNPVFTYSLSETGLDAYVIFNDIAEDVIAGEYDLTTAEAYIRENGEKSDNYTVTVVPAKLLVKRATRTIEFETAAPAAVSFGTTQFSNPVKTYPQVGEQTVTYSIVSTSGIVATVDAEGKLTIDAKTAISADATIMVRAVVGQDDGYLESVPVEYTLTVKPLEAPATGYTLEGTEGANGWYISPVTMKAPAGYMIGFGSETQVPEKWTEEVTCGTQGENTYVYYLQNESGAITAPQTSEVIKIDQSVPKLDVTIDKNVFNTISNQIFAIEGSFQVSVKFSDTHSGVASVKIIVNNEAGEAVKATELTAEQIAEGKYEFTVEPEFRNAIVVEVTDFAGLSAEPYDTKEILIADNTAPEILPEFTGKYLLVSGGDDTAESDDIYFSNGEEFGLKFTVSDNNFDLSTAPLTVKTNDSSEDLVLNDGVTTITLNEEGTYIVTASFTDIAGISTDVVRKYIVDKDDPVIHDLIFSSEPNPVGEEDVVFFTNDKAFSVDITVTDTNYALTADRPVVKLDGVEVSGLTWTDAEDEGKPGAKANLPLTEEGLHEITVTYTDGLHEVNRTYKIHLDFTDPVIDVQLNATDLEPNGDRAYYTGNVTATVTIAEANFDPQLVEVAVTAVDAKGEPVTVDDYTAAAKAAEWTKAGDKYTLDLTFTEEANYTLTVDYTDQAGNAAVEQGKKEFTIDATNPEVPVVTYSQSVGNAIVNQIGGFFNEELELPAVVTITAVDATAGVKEFIVTSSDNTFAERVVAAAQNGDTFTASFTIPAQYNGKLTVVAVDWAKNENTTEDEQRAIVDTVDPTSDIQLNQEVRTANEVKYFNGDIVMNLSIFEANYAYFAENAVITVMKDGQRYEGGVLGNWVRAATATNTFTLTEDGDYEITVTYHDGSNNQMPTWTSGKLTLDTTVPVITATNIKQNSANKDDTYGFVITVSDINLDVETVKPMLNAVVRGEDGLYKTEQIDLGTAQVDADGETVQYTVENLHQDALYTLTCSAKDMSGNETTEILLADGKAYETVNFSINRSGSTFGFGGDATETLVNQYYVYSVYEDVVLVEVNVDPIETYSVTLNGTELTEGTDYTTEQTSNPGEWSKRTYTIKKDLFAAEGQYSIVVSSTDKTNTTAYSDIKDLAVAFVVDQTAPVLTISGLQEGGRYQTSEQTVTLIPTDEGGRLNSLKITILDSDGNPLTAEDGSDISVRVDLSGEELHTYLDENGGMVTFTIPTGLEMQVQVVCNDCAVNAEGLTNEYNELFRRVTVSENWFIIFYANKGAFYGSIGAVVALAAAAVILIRRRKAAK